MHKCNVFFVKMFKIKKNTNFAKKTTDYDNRTMEESSLRGLVEDAGRRCKIYSVITACNTAGSVSAVRTVEEIEELEGRGINPYWNKWEFRKELSKQALQHGVLLDISYLDNREIVHDRKLHNTSENDIYLNPDGETLTKVNNLAYVKGIEHGINLYALIDRFAAHNELFPNVAYKINGFIHNQEGYISLEIEQRYVDAERNATVQEIEKNF